MEFLMITFHENSKLDKEEQIKAKKKRWGVKSFARAIALVLLFASAAHVSQGTTFNVKDYGAKADGKTDIGVAGSLAAWQLACAATVPSTVVVPGGTYEMGQIVLEGPCKSAVTVNVQGTIKCPVDTSNFKSATGWIAIQYLDHFTLAGNGVFDGQGTGLWGKECKRQKYCSQLPINIRFNYLKNSMIRDVTSLNSKQFHVNVLGCKNVTFYQFTVSAPEESLNTDGIHIGRSSGITIKKTNIKTGDDCISIGDGSENININGVTCGPGHGISIGSLGLYKNEAPVVGVTVTGTTFTNTQNGIRLKSWPDSTQNTASNLHFENLVMYNVGNPILIDQEYCPYDQCKLQVPSRVKLSNITFTNIRGTSATELAVKLVCSAGSPCQHVQLSDINLKFSGGPASTLCKNVKPVLGGVQVPKACAVA